jgi:hypothetical protein
MNGPTTSAAQAKTPSESPVDQMFRSLEPYRVSLEWPEHVRAYVEKYPELIPYVLPAVQRTRQEFGDGAGLSLTINDDPEFYDPYLKLYVRLPNYDRETDARFDNICLWLCDATADLEGYFRVTADYRNPAR